jgi:hypothetical protein
MLRVWDYDMTTSFPRNLHFLRLSIDDVGSSSLFCTVLGFDFPSSDDTEVDLLLVLEDGMDLYIPGI